MTYSPFIKPGVLEVFCGPMGSGKTRELINRVDKLNYMDDVKFLFFKPELDTRDAMIKSRFGQLTYPCIKIKPDRPEEILDIVDTRFVSIDEAQFFGRGIENVIEKLLTRAVNVVVAGLDLDFKGEPFGPMPNILAMADEVTKLTAVCSVPGCETPATRTQRLDYRGKPVPYDSPIIKVGAEADGYFARCLNHHEVPRKP